MWFLTRKTETGSFQSSGRTVDFRYSRKSDTLWMRERGREIHHSADARFGIIDFDEGGEVVGVEIFKASETLPEINEELDIQEGPRPFSEFTEDLLPSRKVASYVNEVREHVKM